MSETNHEILFSNASPHVPRTARSPNGGIDEAALMRLARTDKSCFGLLYERYFDPIYAYCLKRVGTPQEAEDLTSLTFVQALNDLDQYRGGPVAAWLFRIAHNRVVDHYRRRRVQVPFESLEFRMAAADAFAQAEDDRMIRELVADLPDRQRDILALKVNGGLTASEIGAIVGMNPGAVRVLLHRLIKRLRARYEATLKQENSL